jgi:hypothetical protein
MVTDGRRTAQLAGNPPRYEVSSEDARKLFVSGDRFAIATYGEAEIDGRSVEDVIADFAAPDEADCERFANALGSHVSELLSEAIEPVRGDLVRAELLRGRVSFVVGAQDEDCGRVFEVKVRPGKSVVEPRLETTDPGVYPFGQTDGIDRFLKGIDLDALQAARLRIEKGKHEKLKLLGYDLIYPETLAEAAELALDLIEIQLLAQRISRGTYADKDPRVAGCGGRIQALTLGASAIEWHSEEAA